MKERDLRHSTYMNLVYAGNIDDMNYGEWKNREICDWLLVAKHKYNQNYIDVIDNYGKNKITYKEWFGDE